MTEPDAFEQMMARMLGAPIPVALGRHPTDLIPFAWVIPGEAMRVWHLDPACDGFWGRDPDGCGMHRATTTISYQPRYPRLTGEPVLLTTRLPHDCAEHGWWPCVWAWHRESVTGEFRGEPIDLDCWRDDDGPHARLTLQPCDLCVVMRERIPR